MGQCRHIKRSGEPCNAWAMTDEKYCFWHSPKHREEAAEARRLGGQRKHRERTVAAAYQFHGLRSYSDILSMLESATTDTLVLPNSVDRSRTLAVIGETARRCLANDHEDSIKKLEAAVLRRDEAPAHDVFDLEPDELQEDIEEEMT